MLTIAVELLPYGYAEAILPLSVVHKITSKCWFAYECNGLTYYYEPTDYYDRQQLGDCPAEISHHLYKAMERIDRLATQASAAVDIVDVYSFIAEYANTKAQMEMELRQVPISKRRLEGKAMWFSLEEEQCVLELIQEQAEKVLAAKKDGEPKDSITVTVSNEMIKAKLEEKLRQKK
jgi:hypothetical protein